MKRTSLEMSVAITNQQINIVLAAWQLPRRRQIYDTADGLVLAALLCNAGAKLIDYDLYEYKEDLIAAAAEIHPLTWNRDGIQYFETCFGQVSFHVFNETWEQDWFDNHSINSAGRNWQGEYMQDKVISITKYFYDVCCE